MVRHPPGQEPADRETIHVKVSPDAKLGWRTFSSFHAFTSVSATIEAFGRALIDAGPADAIQLGSLIDDARQIARENRERG